MLKFRKTCIGSTLQPDAWCWTFFMCISFQFLIADIIINIKLLTGEKSDKTKITRRKKIRNQFSRQFGKNGRNGATQIIKVLIEFFFVRVMKIIVWILASCVKYTLYIFVLKTSSSIIVHRGALMVKPSISLEGWWHQYIPSHRDCTIVYSNLGSKYISPPLPSLEP